MTDRGRRATVGAMIVRSAVALLACALSGCLLAEEDCGAGFAFEDGRCVPLRAPPPFYPDGEPAPDPDDGLPTADATPPPPPDRWADHRIALIVDLTVSGAARQTPATPGADIDAVQAIEVTPGGDVRIGRGAEVLGALFDDPFEGNLNLDATAVLGLPDGRVASLGAEGGFVYVGLDLTRPLRAGDVIVVAELTDPRGEADLYALFMCRTPDSIENCESMGEGGPGITRFTLE